MEPWFIQNGIKGINERSVVRSHLANVAACEKAKEFSAPKEQQQKIKAHMNLIQGKGQTLSQVVSRLGSFNFVVLALEAIQRQEQRGCGILLHT